MLKRPFKIYLQVCPCNFTLLINVPYTLSNSYEVTLYNVMYIFSPLAEIYHIVSKSSTANDAPAAQDIESKTIKPTEVCTFD